MLDPKALFQHAVITYFSLDEYSSRAWQTHCAIGKIQRPLQSLLAPQAQFILLYFPLILYMVDICSKKSSNIWTLGKWCIQMACKGSMCIVVHPILFGVFVQLTRAFSGGVSLTSISLLFYPNHMSWSCYLPWHTKNRILRLMPGRHIYVHYNPCSALFRKVLSTYVCVSWLPSRDEVIFFYTCLPLECALDTSIECALKNII